MGNSSLSQVDVQNEAKDCLAHASNIGKKSELKAVLNKLKKHPNYKDKDMVSLQAEAEHLSTIDGIHTCFSHLVEESALDIQGRVEESMGNTYVTKQEIAHSRQRAHDRHKEASQLVVKIRLSKIQHLTSQVLERLGWDLKLFEYGALHASILVANVLLEWGRESLVIPRADEGWVEEETKLVAEVDTKGSTLAATAATKQSELDSNPDDTFSIYFDITMEKSKLLRRVEEVIVRYNNKYFYNVFKRNCQHFVLDIKRALELENAKFVDPAAEEFLKKLETTKGDIPERRVIHADLDKVVRMHSLEQLKKETVHFLLCQYDLVHNNSHDECQNEECQYLEVLMHYKERNSE